MVKRRSGLLLALAALLAVAMVVFIPFIWSWINRAGRPSAQRDAMTSESDPKLPRIRLARIDAKHEESRTVSRDVFEFGRPPAPPKPAERPGRPLAPPTVKTPPIRLEPTPVPLPPLEVRFIGAVQTPRGEWFAALLTEGKELLTGKEGDVLASRFEIVKIGHESLDIREVVSGRQRRIRLGGR